MKATTNILELKFEGNGINTTKVKPSEVAALISEFEKTILSTIKTEYPAIDTNEVLFTFDSVRNESIGIYFLPNIFRISSEIKTILISSYIFLNTSISSNDFSQLSNDTISSLKAISKFSKKYNCRASFKLDGEQLSFINADTEIKTNKQQLLKGDTTIYGELVDAGGDIPNVHIKINGDYTVIIDTDKQKVKDLASKLYEHVGLKGQARWDVLTSKIIEFKLYEILDYSAGNITAAFSDLRKLSNGYWDDFNTNEEINKRLLRD